MAKIAHLQPQTNRSRNGAAKPMPKPLVAAKDNVIARLVETLSVLLDRADDLLFDMAEKESDANRNCYFDAMRELRLQRQALLSDFSARLGRQFAWPPESESDSPADAVKMESLALVNEEELETDVALDSMARRLQPAAQQGLDAFAHRLAYLSEGRWDFSDKANPLEPRRVASSFSRAMEKLPLEIEARLVVLKLFERQVFSELPALLERANQQLADAGILPDYKAPSAKPKNTSASANPASKGAEAVAPLPQSPDSGGSNDAMFGLLQELMSTLRGSSLAAPGTAGAGLAPANMAVMDNGQVYRNGAPLVSREPVHAVNSGDLLGVLSRLQRLEQALEQGPAGNGATDIRENLSSLLDSEHGKGVHALDKADDDVINLVSLLFDFILDDQALPADIKALIGRLQIPLLKVAISDKQFFSNEQHAARALLNALARAGAQWDPRQGTEDELYQKINDAVHRIIEDYEDDAGLFEQLLDEFQQYFEQQSARYQRIEQRTCEVEEGRLRAAQARERVVAALDQRMAGRQLPAVAVRLLRQHWQQRLYLTWLREGEDSDDWQQQVKVVDAVVWSVLQHREQTALDKLKTLSPRLLKRLQQTLREISVEETEIRQMLGALHKVHQQILEGAAAERVAVVPEAPDEDTLVPQGLPEDHFLVRQASELVPGQWVEINSGKNTQRAKLAANIRHGLKLIFTNRRGMKAAEYSAYELAVALHDGAVKLLEEGALFDRALEAVIGDLRRRHASAQH